jgi:hypothetical protein
MPTKKGKKTSSSDRITWKLLCLMMKREPLFMEQVHHQIRQVSSEIGEDPNEVAAVVKGVIDVAIEETFDVDFTQKPKRSRHFHGHGGH